MLRNRKEGRIFGAAAEDVNQRRDRVALAACPPVGSTTDAIFALLDKPAAAPTARRIPRSIERDARFFRQLAEYRDVLTREKLRRKFPVLTPTFVDEQLEQLLARADFWEDVPKHVTLTRDPKDECYLNLAVESGARYLASRDLDLLDLMKDAEFVAKHPNLIVCDPVQFLTILKSL